MKILFLSRWFPYPADNGARLRISGLLQSLGREGIVDLISFNSEPIREEHLDRGRQDCRWIEAVPYRDFQPRRLESLAGYFGKTPRSITATFSPRMAEAVRQALDREEYDLVIASQRDMVEYARQISASPVLLEELELASLFEMPGQPNGKMGRIRRQLTRAKTSAYYRRHLPRFAGCTVVSKKEEQLLKELLPDFGPVRVIPNGINIQQYQAVRPAVKVDTLIYCGSLTYEANRDAVSYFIEEIFPLILSQRPSVKLRVTGSTDGVRWARGMVPDSVEFTGYLKDVRPAIAESWVSVVPLRHGGGTRMKILESLALGTPVVATSKGVEGLDLMADHEIMLADDPQEFARATAELLADPESRARLSGAGRDAALRYDWQKIAPTFIQFVHELAQMQRSGSHPVTVAA